MKIAERIKQLRESRGWTQEELARECGWKRQARISNYEKGRQKGGREPDQETIGLIARAFGMTIAEFMAPVGHTVRQPAATYDTNVSPGPNLHSVALISFLEAGKLVQLDQYPPRQGRTMIKTTAEVGPRAFALRVEDDSMTAPAGTSIPAGYTVVVDPDAGYTNRSIVVAKFDGDNAAILKQLILDGPNKYLRSLNPAYAPIPIGENCQIIGVVKKVEFDL